MINLNGSVLGIATRLDNVYAYDVNISRETLKDGTKVYQLTGGFALSIFLELSILLNFSYSLDPSVGPQDFGKPGAENIDLFAMSYSLTPSRCRIMDAPFAIFTSKISLFINHEVTDQRRDILLTPFAPKTWGMILVLGIILAISAAIFAIFERRSIGDFIFQCISQLLQSDSEFRLRLNSSQLLLWITSISFLILHVSLTGNIISIKSVNKHRTTTLEDVLALDLDVFLKPGYNNTAGPIQEIAEGAAEVLPLIKQFLQGVSKTKTLYPDATSKLAIQKLNSGSGAYIVEDETALAMIHSQVGYFPCSWEKISFLNIEIPWSFLMKKHSPYRLAINMGVLKLQESGILKVFQKRWLPRFQRCTNRTKGLPSVELQQLRAAFLILLVGYILALVALVLENYLLTSEQKLKRSLPVMMF